MTLHPGGTSTPRRVVHTSRSRSLRSAVLACSSSSLSLSSITSNGGRLLELAPPARAVGATSLGGWAGWPCWPVARTKVEREPWNMLFCAQCLLVVAPPQARARKRRGGAALASGLCVLRGAENAYPTNLITLGERCAPSLQTEPI